MILKLKKKTLRILKEINKFYTAKKTTYSIRFIILKQIIKQRFYDHPRVRFLYERAMWAWIRFLSKEGNAIPTMYVLLPLKAVYDLYQVLKKYFFATLEYCSEEIWFIIEDVASATKYLLLLPWKICLKLHKFLNTPWNKKKILRVLKIPLSIHLYRFVKKHVWMPIWVRVDYSWFCYSFCLFIVNYNFLVMEREERWYSYSHEPASWDYNWLMWLH